MVQLPAVNLHLLVAPVVLLQPVEQHCNRTCPAVLWPWCRQFFLNGKVLPVERGAGVNQGSISVAARALGSGDWLHIFPEGRVVPSGQVGPFRQGIGKLICEARAVQGR